MSNNILSNVQKAQRVNKPARIGLPGGSGYGKTMTGLRFASLFAQREGGRILLVDTEKGSSALYAANKGEVVDNEERFDFDIYQFDEPYTTAELIQVIKAAAANDTYSVLMIDSISHFWFAAGGILDQARMLETSRMNGFQAIAKAKELHYYPLVEAIIDAPIHIIVTLRSKNAYDIGKDSNNRTTITRLGEAPRFEESFLYELDLTVEAGKGNIFNVDKTRYTPFSDLTVEKPTREWIEPFAEFLSGGVADPYVYGDGTTVASTAAKRIFNEYRAENADAVPASAEALKSWYEASKEVAQKEGGDEEGK